MSEPAKPSAAWNLRELKGTKGDLIEQITAAAFVPPSAKAFLVEAVRGLDNPATLFRVDCHVFYIDAGRGMSALGGFNISAL